MINPPSDGVGVDSVFEGNHLHDLCTGTADAGAFYAGASWANRGNIVRNNAFARLYQTENMAQHTAISGVYLDTLEAGWTIENNHFDSMDVGVFVAGGRQNTITRNAFINCSIPLFFDSHGLDIKCGVNGECLGVQFPKQCGCPGNYIEELNRTFSYRKAPWATAFPNIRTDLLEKGHAPPVWNMVVANTFCRAPANATPAPTPGCARCPASHGHLFIPMPGFGSYCCSQPSVGGKSCPGSICCLRPGTHKKTTYGDHGCEGIQRCGSNSANHTPCAVAPAPPMFTNYFVDTAAKVEWANTFANNTLVNCATSSGGRTGAYPPSQDIFVPGAPMVMVGTGDSRPVACYRLPALVTAGSDGVVLAFASARNWTGDGCLPLDSVVVGTGMNSTQHLALRRSTDGGRSFGPIRQVRKTPQRLVGVGRF
jgi:hypothetical protein